MRKVNPQKLLAFVKRIEELEELEELQGVQKVNQNFEFYAFRSEMISANHLSDPRTSESFNDIFDILKKNDFDILSGVDCGEVLAFVA
jgi:hypothetical protein